MTSKVAVQGAVLFIVILIGSVLSQDGSGSRTSRRRRCRCKKYITDLNKDIDRRLKQFEDKFERYFAQSVDDITNKTQNTITDYNDRALNMITEDLNMTSQTLKLESFSLRKLQQSIRSQKVTVDMLNTNFKELDSIVRNLSTVVERLEEAMRTSFDNSKNKPSELRKVSKRRKHKQRNTPPPPTYPEGK